ncbi:MAG: S-layer homology domain-containing protein, partial [Oscillospiraceae bacterium]
INSDSYIKNVNITKVGNLGVDVPAEKTLFVKIDNLTFNGPGTLGRGSVYVNGGGTVYLQVDNILGDGSKFINYPSNYIPFDTYTLRNDNKLVMNVKNSSNSTLTNLLAEADVYFDNSITLDGSFKVCGNVIASGDVLYKGTLDTTDKQFNVIGQVYAPNGHVSLNRQARVRGQLLAHSAELFSNTSLFYDTFDYIKINAEAPIDPVVPIDPEKPVDPVAPVDPVVPVDPEKPIKPEKPVESELIPDNDVTTPEISISLDYAYIYGYTDSLMGPDKAITREEAAALVNRVLYQSDKRQGFKKPRNSSFLDMAPENWAYSALEYMTAIGVYNKGDGNQRIFPNREVSRGEVAKIIAFAFGLQPSGNEMTFNDLKPTDKFYKYIDALVSRGYLEGFNDGTIRANDTMTRAEFVTMFNKIIGRNNNKYKLVDKEGNQMPYMFTDINGHWAYEDILRATNSFDVNGNVDNSHRLNRNDLDFELSF